MIDRGSERVDLDGRGAGVDIELQFRGSGEPGHVDRRKAGPRLGNGISADDFGSDRLYRDDGRTRPDVYLMLDGSGEPGRLDGGRSGPDVGGGFVCVDIVRFGGRRHSRDTRKNIDYVIDGGSERLGFYRGRSGANVYIMLGRGGEPGYLDDRGTGLDRGVGIDVDDGGSRCGRIYRGSSGGNVDHVVNACFQTLDLDGRSSGAGLGVGVGFVYRNGGCGSIHGGSASRNLGGCFGVGRVYGGIDGGRDPARTSTSCSALVASPDTSIVGSPATISAAVSELTTGVASPAALDGRIACPHVDHVLRGGREPGDRDRRDARGDIDGDANVANRGDGGGGINSGRPRQNVDLVIGRGSFRRGSDRRDPGTYIEGVIGGGGFRLGYDGRISGSDIYGERR